MIVGMQGSIDRQPEFLRGVVSNEGPQKQQWPSPGTEIFIGCFLEEASVGGRCHLAALVLENIRFCNATGIFEQSMPRPLAKSVIF